MYERSVLAVSDGASVVPPGVTPAVWIDFKFLIGVCNEADFRSHLSSLRCADDPASPSCTEVERTLRSNKDDFQRVR